jgi:hypothetical protein
MTKISWILRIAAGISLLTGCTSNSSPSVAEIDPEVMSTTAAVQYEAESATLSGGANKATNHAGYSGAGFVDGFYWSTTAQVSFTVNAATAGSYLAKLHYSAGNGTSTNTGLYVNGVKIKNITCAATANWDTWADESETVTLKAGNNTIVYKAETSVTSCINLDRLAVSAVGCTPPTITQQPANYTWDGVSNRAYFTVATQGSSSNTYQWRFQIDGDSTVHNCSDAANYFPVNDQPTLTAVVPLATNAAHIWCVITDACGNTVESAHAAYAVNGVYTISTSAGANGSFSPTGPVTVLGNASQTFTIIPDANYQVGSVTVDGVSQGAITTYTFPHVTANHAISATFACAPPTITQQPANYTWDGVSNRAYFTVATQGGSSNTYQWRFQIDGDPTVHNCSEAANYFPVNDQPTLTAVMPLATNAAHIWCVVTNPCGSTVESNHAAYLMYPPHTITASAGANGTISPSGQVSVPGNSNQTFTITPNTNFQVSSVMVDGVNQGAIRTYTFSQVTANHAISATFASCAPPTITQQPANYTWDGVSNRAYFSVTAQGGSSNTYQWRFQIDGDPTVHNCSEAANYFPVNDQPTLTAVMPLATNAAHIWCVVTNPCGSTVESNHAAYLMYPPKTITASAGANGTISPSGQVSVATNGSQTFTITPNANFQVSAVMVDGVNQGAITTYTFTQVTANHTISATFATCTLPTITQQPTDYTWDGVSNRAYFSVTAQGGSSNTYQWRFQIDGDSTVHNCSEAANYFPVNDQPTLTAVMPLATNAAHIWCVVTNPCGSTVESNHAAYLMYPPKTITASAGANGTISPSGQVSVATNGSQTFTITPNANFQVSAVMVDGVNQGAITTYTFTQVTANHTISATFTAKSSVTTYEAEDATLSGGANRATNHSGYSGTGFVDGFFNSTTAQVSFTVNAASTGSYTAKLHYSAGNGTSTNTGLYVNGVKVKNITSAATSNWDTWADESETVTLKAGINTIVYKAETSSGSCINLDKLTITPAGCTALAIAQQPSGYTWDGLANRAYFSVAAQGGSNNTYQWRFQADGDTTVHNCSESPMYFPVNDQPVLTAVLPIPLVSGQIWCVITDACGNTVESAHAPYYTNSAYTISASAGSKGSIGPSGTVAVASNASQTFTITPDGGYQVQTVVVDGVNQGAITTYTFAKVTANHTIAATFAVRTDNGVYEAESATLSGGANKAVNHTGYSGTGFVDGFFNSTTAQVSFAVYAVSGGSYTAKLHYSAGNGASTNVGLYVNGVKIKNITAPATASWDAWGDESETVTLIGGSNTIAYKAETSSPSCINLDKVVVSATGCTAPTIIQQPSDYTWDGITNRAYFFAAAQGGANYTYQWRFQVDGDSAIHNCNEESQYFPVNDQPLLRVVNPIPATSAHFWLVVTDACGDVAESNHAAYRAP